MRRATSRNSRSAICERWSSLSSRSWRHSIKEIRRESQSSGVAGKWYPVSSCAFEELLWRDARDALAFQQRRPWHSFPAASHRVLRLTNFDETMHADRRQASLGLHAKVESVEALAIAVHIEIGDGPGHRFEMVDHRANVATGTRPRAFECLACQEPLRGNGGVDV